MVGKTVSHYQILERLGEGGMGVVCRALDTRLNRSVAIKILAAGATADPERKRRFVQEAKVASSLNHPNIITIYDIDDIEDGTFIVMEHVRGKTLGQLIGRKGLALRDTLNYAVQISSALEAAHGAGIIHRDIKPANIMVTEQGLVKVLDFGLAKLAEPVESSDAGLTTTSTPARTARGAIVGTAAYMSPEQAEGKSLDTRSDVFSFGALLYEMVTGRQAFEGSTSISVLAAILKEEPKPISDSLEPVPAALEGIIGLCLRKEPERRYQHMADVRVALEQLQDQLRSARPPSGAGSAVAAAAPPPSRRRLVIGISCGLVLAAALGALTWWLFRSPAPAQPLGPFRLTSEQGLTSDPALSRDGKWLAYTSDRGTQPNAHIYVQQILRGEPMRLGDPIPLTSGEAEDSDPSFSPVVAEIVFHSYRPGRGTDEIYSIPVSGGEPKLIARRGQNPRYSPDGKHIAYWEGSAADLASPGKIYVVGADGGVTKQLAPDLPDARYPIWSPNGKYLLVPGRDPTFPRNEALDWWLVPVDGGSAVKTNASDILRQQDLEVYLGPGDWTGDWVLFSARIKGSSANLWRLRIVPNTGEFTGRAQRVTFGTADEAQPSVAAGGLLVFSSLKVIRNIWRLPVDADRGKVLGDMQRLTSSEALDINPSLSADGKRLVFLSNRSESWSIWRKDLESGKERALSAISSDGSSPIITADASFPIITADGSGVAYSADENRRHAIYTMPADGGVAERRCADCGTARSWSSDQKSVLYVAGQTGQIGLLNLASGQKTILLQHPDFSLDQPQFSPDDHWIAFVARGRGGDRARLCIAPFKGAAPPAQSEWIAVTDGQAWDDKPQWSPAGTFLYFYSTRDGFGCVWKQRLDQANKRPRGEPAEIWPFHKPGPSLSQTFLHAFEIAVAHDKIVLNAVEITGNIWWTRLPE